MSSFMVVGIPINCSNLSTDIEIKIAGEELFNVCIYGSKEISETNYLVGNGICSSGKEKEIC